MLFYMILKLYLYTDNTRNISMINVQKSTPELHGEALLHSLGAFAADSLKASDVLGLLLLHLEKEHGISRVQLKKLVSDQKEQVLIPLSVFSDRLSALETVVKYMSENLGLKNSRISGLLSRNVRTTWTTYRNASQKLPERFSLSIPERFYIPASALADRRFSTLESIVLHLRENYNLSLHEIALLLKRDDSTIWTVYHRAEKKALRKK
jgi:hypothetical protein